MAAQAKTTTTKATSPRGKQTALQLKPRDPNKKKRGIMASTSNSISEIADTVSETAEALRRTMSITNTMLKGMEGEVYFDAVEELMSRGLTAEQAVAYMEAA